MNSNQPATPTGPARGPILVCFAVPNEAAPFRRQLGEHPDRNPPLQIQTLVTGMGPHAARRALLEHLRLHTHPALLLTTGFAGALHPDLPSGAVLFDADPDFPLRDPLLAAGARPASIHCADRVATTARDKHALRTATGADAVEMESGVLRRIARDHAIPSATVRAISDTADTDLPLDFNTLLRDDGRLDALGLALSIARRPSRIPALIRLGRHSAHAADALARTLLACLASGPGPAGPRTR